MTPRLFVYGTLLLPDVLQVVLGRRIEGRPSRLADHARFALRGRVYPAVVPRPGAVTEGLVLEGLGAGELARLDRFEGDLYERRVARLLDEEAEATTAVYVLAERHRELLATKAWDAVAFERAHGAHYLERCRVWALHDGRRGAIAGS